VVSLEMTLSALRRPRAFWISVCNVIRLACSVVGVVLLFWYALPNEPPGGPEALGIGRGGGPAWEALRQLYDRYEHWGLGLVLLGTVLEAVPPVCTAIGSWRRRTVPRPAPAATGSANGQSNDPQPGPRAEPTGDGSAMAALQVETAVLRERLADKDDVIDDLRRRLDAEAEERRKLTLMLTDRRPQIRWWRRWRRVA
jgi:hypothetical protein